MDDDPLRNVICNQRGRLSRPSLECHAAAQTRGGLGLLNQIAGEQTQTRNPLIQSLGRLPRASAAPAVAHDLTPGY